MATGIWTKHLDINGRVYYYNAAQSRSVWFPPKDAAIHEALNISIPETINNIENSNNINNNINDNTDTSPADKIVDDVDIYINQISNSILGNESEPNDNNTNSNTITYDEVNFTAIDVNTINNNATSYQPIPIVNPLANINVPSSSAIEDRIQQALTNTKQQFKQTQANKRFKSNETNDSVISNYERQRNELEAMMGSKRDEGGKWLVR
mmetsp:Transcript_6500/g.5829  ORF Transcript_6500/g.5829 Transcript_6500/m.5829 type:complete len:209 (+) Transcript_6500:54-680(+)